MRLNVMLASDERIVVVDVDPSEQVENVKAILEVETQVPLAQQLLVHNGRQLPNTASMKEAGVKEDDLLLLSIATSRSAAGISAASAPPSSSSTPPAMAQNEDGTAVDPAAFRSYVLSHPEIINRLSLMNPSLGETIKRGNLQEIQQMLSYLRKMSNEMERKAREEAELLSADPFDPEAQRKIEAAIQQKNIDENYETAYEQNPELFVSVHMLYVEMEVNSTPLKAFVDSGAQRTIMSKQCAERCGLMRLVDTRYHGIARGVGTTKIFGRIHSAQLKIGSKFFVCSIDVLEANNMDFLFGLDMLRRHECSIDLKRNVLSVGGGEISVPFLAEKDAPNWLDKFDDDISSPSSSAPAAPFSLPQPSTSSPAAAAAGGGGGGASAMDVASSQPTSSAVPSQPQQPAAAAAPVPAAAPPAFETKVNRLMELGFDRASVVQALTLTNGNEDAAVGILFGG